MGSIQVGTGNVILGMQWGICAACRSLGDICLEMTVGPMGLVKFSSRTGQEERAEMTAVLYDK